MTHSISQSAIIGFLIGHLSTAAWSAPIPSDAARPRVGILRVGEAVSSREEKAFSLVEKRVQQWMENSSTFFPQVESLPLSLQTEHVKLEAEKSRLGLLARELRSKEAARRPAVLAEMRALRAKLLPVSRYVPTVQRALVAEAEILWEEGQKKESSSLLRQAVVLHPDGILEEPEFSTEDLHANWEEELSEPGSWKAQETNAVSGVKRNCEVRLRGAPDSEVVVNGFGFGRRREFQLPAGGDYHFQLVSTSHEIWESRVPCSRQGKRELNVLLRPATPRGRSPELDLTKITQGQQMSSLFLIQAAADRFRLFLFTPGNSLEEIPLQKPLRVADVLDNPGDRSLPVARDTMERLFRRHQLAQLNVGMSASDSSASLSSSFENREVVWYNDWKVWAVAGGVLTGILVGYLATRGPDVKTQSGPGVRIQLQ